MVARGIWDAGARFESDIFYFEQAVDMISSDPVLFFGLSPSGKAQDFDSYIHWFESS